MKHATLYKQDTTGRTRIWFMETDGPRYRTTSGLLDGQHVTTEWTVTEPKNTGRSNSTTADEQAWLEVKAQYRLKLRKDYHESVQDIEVQKFFKPMLAKDYAKESKRLDWKQPVYAQPKLDGIRCIATVAGLWTRTGKPITAVPHVHEALAHLFDVDPDLVLDGELYNHDLRTEFEQIVSLVRKQSPDKARLAKAAELVQYHVYDAPSVDKNFGGRAEFIQELDIKSTAIVRVPTFKLRDEEHGDELYAKFVSAGYEGGIVRADGPYEQKRSSLLLKRKDFNDAEFEILRIEEGLGNWSGVAKRVFFKLEDGRECGAGLKGSKEYAKHVLDNASSYIGKQLTVQYFGLSAEGVPRFPIAVILHEDERW